MAYETPTALICSDLAIGWQSGLDLTVDLKPIPDSADMRRTWNARLVNLADDAFRLYQVRITSGDGEMRTPALSRLWPGVEFALVPTTELADRIATGGSSRTLNRDPHPGSVRCLDLGFEDIPFTVSGRVVTLAAPAAGPVRIYYRPVLQLMVTEPWTVSEREKDAEVSWSLAAEEVGGDE